MNKDKTTVCNCVKCTTARLKDLRLPTKDPADSEKENLLNKICDEVESECFSDDGDYSREKMKERLEHNLLTFS